MYMTKNNDKIFVNTRIRWNGAKVNIFDKVNHIKGDIKSFIPEIRDEQYLSIFSHIRNHQYGKLHYGRRSIKENIARKRELTDQEKKILSYLNESKLNPSTTYRWFIACRVPDDIKEKLEQGKISYRKAIQIADNRRKSKLSNSGLLMMEEINNVIRSL